MEKIVQYIIKGLKWFNKQAFHELVISEPRKEVNEKYAGGYYNERV